MRGQYRSSQQVAIPAMKQYRTLEEVQFSWAKNETKVAKLFTNTCYSEDKLRNNT